MEQEILTHSKHIVYSIYFDWPFTNFLFYILWVTAIDLSIEIQGVKVMVLSTTFNNASDTHGFQFYWWRKP
jgi:hypothetical protein